MPCLIFHSDSNFISKLALQCVETRQFEYTVTYLLKISLMHQFESQFTAKKWIGFELWNNQESVNFGSITFRLEFSKTAARCPAAGLNRLQKGLNIVLVLPSCIHYRYFILIILLYLWCLLLIGCWPIFPHDSLLKLFPSPVGRQNSHSLLCPFRYFLLQPCIVHVVRCPFRFSSYISFIAFFSYFYHYFLYQGNPINFYILPFWSCFSANQLHAQDQRGRSLNFVQIMKLLLVSLRSISETTNTWVQGEGWSLGSILL